MSKIKSSLIGRSYAISRILSKLDLLVNKFHQLTGISKKILISGKPVLIPFVKGLYCNPAEPWMSALLKYVLRNQKGIIIDIGVNLGQTLVKVKSIDPTREYVGFEPNPCCFHYLHCLAKLNGWSGIKVYPFAIGLNLEVMDLNFQSENPTEPSASILSSLRDQSQTVSTKPVVILPASEVLTRITSSKQIGIIKIDVEGAELEVLESIQFILITHKPLLFLEFLPIYDVNNSFRFNRVRQAEALLRDLGYYLYKIIKGSDGQFVNVKPIELIPVNTTLAECDYIAVHLEQKKLFSNL